MESFVDVFVFVGLVLMKFFLSIKKKKSSSSWDEMSWSNKQLDSWGQVNGSNSNNGPINGFNWPWFQPNPFTARLMGAL